MHQKRVRSEFVWNRLGSEQLPYKDPAVPLSQTLNGGRGPPTLEPSDPKAPTVRATLPGEEYTKGQHGKSSLSHDLGDAARLRRVPDAKPDVPQKLQRPMPPTRARQFHLTRNSFLSPSHVEAGHGIHKRTRMGKDQLAVLMEGNATRPKHPKNPYQSTMPEDASHREPSIMPLAQTKPAQSQTGSLKRPNATAEELKWRARTWNKPANANQMPSKTPESKQDGGESASVSDVNSFALAEKLHDFGLQVTQNRVEDAPAVTTKPKLKFQPKPPTPRSQRQLPREVAIQGDVMAMEDDSMNDDEYVYDTYVRAGELSQNVPSKDSQREDAAREMQPDKVGVFFIEEGDEPIWQEYLEDTEYDKDWDSEDEDENGVYMSLSRLDNTLALDGITDNSSGGLLWQRLPRG